MLEIKADIDAAERMLSDLGRKQLPFATAMAINDTADAIKRMHELDLSVTFDRPTPFTRRGIYTRRASKSRLEAQVGMKRVQAEYLKLQASGGTRRPKGRAIVTPTQQRVNKYGNLPRGAVQRLLRREDVFTAGRGKRGTGHLAPGIYKRPRRRGSDPKLMIAFVARAQYSRRLPFQKRSLDRARTVFPDRFIRRMREALRTAR